MSSSKDGRASSSSLPPAEKTPQQPKYSSAAFLHHLHTDPSSHHVSLTAPTLPTGIPTPAELLDAEGRASDNRMLAGFDEPGSSFLDRPMLPTRRSSAGTARTLMKQPSNPVLVDSPSSTPGPSVPGPIPPFGRTRSKRGRPMTAPGGLPAEAFLPASLPSTLGSPNNQSTVEELEDPPFIPAQEDSEGSLDGEGEYFDSCGIDTLASEMGQAMDMMDISGTGSKRRGPSRVFGRADNASEKRAENEQQATEAFRDRDPTRLQSDPSPRRTSSLVDLDWASFGQAYAHGNFDPIKIPLPPRSPLHPPRTFTAQSSPGGSYSATGVRRSGTATSSSVASGSTGPFSQASGSSDSNTTWASTNSAALEGPMPNLGKSLSSSTIPTTGTAAGRIRPYEMESLASRRPRAGDIDTDHLALPSYSLAAATIRMAGVNIDQSVLAPLGMPSPDRELLDPMSSMFSPESSLLQRDGSSSDPGGGRLTLNRSMSQATMSRDREASHLPTIAASPAGTPLGHPSHGKSKGKPIFELPRRSTSPTPPIMKLLGPGGIVSQRIPSATAPVEKVVAAEQDDDYFGTAVVTPVFDRRESTRSQSSSTQTVTQAATPMARTKSNEASPPTPPTETPTPDQSPPPALAQPADIGRLYEKYGWLAAPIPPDEIARRKALYRFNILHASSDVNFDRIAHMTKLVFNTKIVIISLTDAETQWHKTDMGLGTDQASRISSFCSHTLLLK